MPKKKIEVAWEISCLIQNSGDFCSAKRKKGDCKKRQSGRKSRGRRLDQGIRPSSGQKRRKHSGSWSHGDLIYPPGRRDKSSRNRGRKSGLGRWDLWRPPQRFPIPGTVPSTKPWLSPRSQRYGPALGQTPIIININCLVSRMGGLEQKLLI